MKKLLLGICLVFNTTIFAMDTTQEKISKLYWYEKDNRVPMVRLFLSTFTPLFSLENDTAHYRVNEMNFDNPLMKYYDIETIYSIDLDSVELQNSDVVLYDKQRIKWRYKLKKNKTKEPEYMTLKDLGDFEKREYKVADDSPVRRVYQASTNNSNIDLAGMIKSIQECGDDCTPKSENKFKEFITNPRKMGALIATLFVVTGLTVVTIAEVKKRSKRTA